MVQWLCRAPHLEQYFLLSLDIFKRNFKDVDVEVRSCRVAAETVSTYVSLPKHALFGWQVLSVQREMQKMQKEFDAGPPDDETAVTWTKSSLVCHRSAVALSGPHFGVCQSVMVYRLPLGIF